MNTTYYNELEPYPAQWLRNLIDAGHIAPGYVDERNIREVQPDDLTTYTQCHFFAGIGIWSCALRLAGWPDDRAVWTGSCPCQPFSSAGKRGGADDPRHLWPEWFRLIRECQPPIIFGEQVASKDGLAWLDLVLSDLEGAGYAVAAVDLCAAGAGAPHIRQRLYFMADSQRHGNEAQHIHSGQPDPIRNSSDGSMANALGTERWPGAIEPVGGSEAGELGDTDQQQRDGSRDTGKGRRGESSNNGFWSELEWLPCRDGKARPTKPGLFPLADGYSRQVAKLRAIGNAIVAPLAAEFIRAYMELTA